MQLKIGTKNFERFTKIPIPLTVKFYLFNVTNSEKVLLGLERPQFRQVGPFVYKQWRRREVVDILDNNRKLIYKEFKTFYAVPLTPESQTPTGGNGSEPNSSHNNNNNHNMLDPTQVNVTIINLPLLSVLTQLAQLEEGSLKRQLAAKVASRLIDSGKEKILITRPANQLLFDGYKVGLMDAANDLITNTLGFNFDSPLPRNKFGFFHTKNGTWSRKESGELTVFTGRNNSMDDFMIVDNWNGLKQLKVWPNNTEAGNRCNEIRGTDGSQFHPGVTRDQTLNIFSPMICTSIFIKYKEDTSAEDIPLLRFSTPPDVFSAPKKNPRNACYCTISNRAQSNTSPLMSSSLLPTSAHKAYSGSKSSRISDDRCYIDGLMDLSLCQKGAPVAASSPHFYNADPLLAHAAGLEPDKDLHETYIDIEPMTGAVMRAASRAQLNAFVERAALDVVDSQLIGHMTPMVAPMLWLEESAEIDDKSAKEFKGQLLNFVLKLKKSLFFVIILGILLLLAVSVQYWYVTCYRIDIDQARKRQEAKEELAEAKLRRRRQKLEQLRRGSSRGQYETNLRLATGGADARRSNLAVRRQQEGQQAIRSSTRKPLIESGGDELMDEPTTGGSKAVPLVAMAAAAALGAADAQRRAAQRERRRNRRPDYDEMDDEDEEQLSRRNLVDNEWKVGEASHGNTSNSDADQSGLSGNHQSDDPIAGSSRAHGGDENLGQSISDLSEEPRAASTSPDQQPTTPEDY